jgi:hypothetical protein
MRNVRRGSILIGLVLASHFWAVAAPAQAEPVSQLNFTSGSVALKLGSTTLLSGSFTQNGTILMGQYQPLPNISPPIALGPYTFSIFTGGPNPVPSGSTSGSTIVADLTALSAGLTGPFLPPSPGLTMNIGGQAAGSFDAITSAFTEVTWTRVLTEPGMPTGWDGKSLVFTLNGTAQLAAVPLPGAALFFASGISGLAMVRKRFVA